MTDKSKINNSIIKIKADSFRRRIHSATEELNMLQTTCPHAYVEISDKGDTGNYDPSCDSYWKEFRCPECGKYWTEDNE